MVDIKSFFAQFTKANFYSRVDNVHPLELHMGLDDKGRKSIELREKFKPRKVIGTTAIEINQYKKPEYNIIRFSLTDEDMCGLFYTFCEDLIEQTRDPNPDQTGYTSIINRFHQWKKMFVSSKKDFLSENSIMGLIGEILFMRDSLAMRIGLSPALTSWSGQELTHKDFSYGDTWAESKAISRGSSLVKISSLEQLESDVPGELAVCSLEKMSTEYNGITLNKLVLETFKKFVSKEDQDLFMSKVALQGYEYSSYYDNFVYEISSFKRYLVREDFPRLTPKDVPTAIPKASYEISLAELAEFEITD